MQIEACNRVMSTGESVNFELVAVRPNATPYIASVNLFPTRDASGAIFGVGGIGRDITEQRRAEQQRSQLAAIVNASQDAIISTSVDGKINSWNAGAERLYGISASEALGQGMDLIVPGEAGPR